MPQAFHRPVELRRRHQPVRAEQLPLLDSPNATARGREYNVAPHNSLLRLALDKSASCPVKKIKAGSATRSATTTPQKKECQFMRAPSDIAELQPPSSPLIPALPRYP